MGNCWGRFLGPGAPVHSAATSGETRSSKDARHSGWSKSTTNSNSMATGTSSSPSGLDSLPTTPKPTRTVLPDGNLRVFTFNELKSATRNFRPDSLLGQGGFGCVFKGWVDEQQGFIATRPGTGMVIAVKKLNNESLQGRKEWLAEVNYLGQLSHLNLVTLIGYCCEDDHLLLVYEFMPKGSLENHLFRKGSYHQPLPWATRMKIALGAAKGLAFLHEAKPQVIYRDFKTSNILLDSNYDAKLSDFGLATDGPTGTKSHVTTRVMGTYGYAAPEYMATGHLTARSDVYGFGVVLLELISGLRSLDPNRPPGQHKLVEWAKPMLSDRRKIHRVVDQRLDGRYSSKAAFKAASLAMQCLNTEAKQRPLMKEVVEKLEVICALKDRTVNAHGKRIVTGIHGSNSHYLPNHINGSSQYYYARSPRQ